MPLKLKNKKFKIFDSESLKDIHKRIFFSIAIFIISYFFIFYNLFESMVFEQHLQKNKDVVINTKEIQRGSIFDRNGVLLASSYKSYSLFVHSDKIKEKNINKISNELSQILPLSETYIKSKLTKKNRFWLKRNISPKQYLEILKLGQTGLQVKIENQRLYPYKYLTSHVVGFTDVDNKGLSGIERGLNQKLDEGIDIYLSIDTRLQEVLRRELKKTINKFSAQSGLSVIMDIPSGEILSLVNFPDFDPNYKDKILPKTQFNSATQGVYEMGSTFKPLTMAIGFEKNIINSDMQFDVSEPIKYGKFIINDHVPHDGNLDIKGIVVNSSNIGAAKVAEKIGKKNQIEFFEKLGFFDKIKLEIKETSMPLLPSHWSQIETMTMGYGYGISITPLHLCKAYGTIANGGFEIYPTLLLDERVNNSSKKIFKDVTSDKFKLLLRSVILETKYTGPRAKVDGYDLGGKTGTAELLTSEGYNKKSNLASFIGVFPISNPKYIVLAMIKDPKKIKETNYNNTGGWVSAPLVKEIILNMINIIGIPFIVEEDIINAKNNIFSLENVNASLRN